MQELQGQLENGTISVIASSTACVPFHRDTWIQPRYQNGNLKRTFLYKIWVTRQNPLLKYLGISTAVFGGVSRGTGNERKNTFQEWIEGREGKGQVNQNSQNPKQVELQVFQETTFFLFPSKILNLQ